MGDFTPGDSPDAIRQAALKYSDALARLQSALDRLSERTDDAIGDERARSAFARSWNTVCKRRSTVEKLLEELTEVVEDLFDGVQAEEALQEPGDSVPWEQVKAELGLT
jgi:predicted RNase H-like HicB family nuclease